MLLILSEESDGSTDHVINWLDYFSVNYKRINDSSLIEINTVFLSDEGVTWDICVKEDFNFRPFTVSSNCINSFWYRRGELNVKKSLTIPENFSNTHFRVAEKLRKCINENQKDIIDFLYQNLQCTKSIGSYYDNDTVKLLNLQIAIQCALLIPTTAIVNSRQELLRFLQKHGKCITKGIKYNGIHLKDELTGGCGTVVVNEGDLKDVADTFAPSLIQKYQEKLFEIRIFYLDGICYSAAIFSQQDEKTKIDFRNYNIECSNRIVPYKLPVEIEKKLIQFMGCIKMKSGSIDLIVTPEMDYIFLEVNPVGQFGWISNSCNYHIDKVIASYFRN